MKKKEYQLHQGIKKWNIIFTFFFVYVGGLLFYILLDNYKLPTYITFADGLVLTLAVFRMIRVFVYDNIFLFLREFFMDKHVITLRGQEYVSFVLSVSPMKITLHKLILCPWCMGIWIAMCSVFVFYYWPASYILFVILAIAGTASLIQLVANSIGWHAEHTKLKTEQAGSEK